MYKFLFTYVALLKYTPSDHKNKLKEKTLNSTIDILDATDNLVMQIISRFISVCESHPMWVTLTAVYSKVKPSKATVPLDKAITVVFDVYKYESLSYVFSSYIFWSLIIMCSRALIQCYFQIIWLIYKFILRLGNESN